MQHAPAKPLRDWLDSTASCLWTPDASISVSKILQGSLFGHALHELRGRSLLIASSDQLTTALALIELDGIARRLTICTPDLPSEQFPYLAATTEAEGVVCGPAPAAHMGDMLAS